MVLKTSKIVETASMTWKHSAAFLKFDLCGATGAYAFDGLAASIAGDANHDIAYRNVVLRMGAHVRKPCFLAIVALKGKSTFLASALTDFIANYGDALEKYKDFVIARTGFVVSSETTDTTHFGPFDFNLPQFVLGSSDEMTVLYLCRDMSNTANTTRSWHRAMEYDMAYLT